MAISSVSGSTPQDDRKQVNIKPQEKNPQDINIFGDKNNNKIVDKEDFDNQEFASYVEANGFIGKSWDSFKNTVTELYDKFMTEFTTQKETLGELEKLDKENKKQNIEESLNKFGQDNETSNSIDQETIEEIKNAEAEQKRGKIENSIKNPPNNGLD